MHNENKGSILMDAGRNLNQETYFPFMVNTTFGPPSPRFRIINISNIWEQT